MSEVVTVEVKLNVPKEAKDVVDLVDAVLEKALAKADLASYAGLIGGLMTAVDGAQSVPAELASQYRDDLAGYLVQKLMARLAPAK